MSLRVLVADDHPVFRDGLRTAFGLADGITLVAEAASGPEVVALAAEHRPDVVVMDLQMPELNGIEATRRIVAAQPDVAVLVLTMFEDDESVFAAMRAGARGYLLKGDGPADIQRAVQAVARGEAIFGAAVARRVFEFLTAPRAPEPFPELTEREREVLALVARGRSNQRIAAELFLSTKTVRNYVSTILTKLCVTDRMEAMVRAREAGLGVGTELPGSDGTSAS